MITTWNTIGFKTGKSIQAIEDIKTGNILSAHYLNGEQLTKEEIEEELF